MKRSAQPQSRWVGWVRWTSPAVVAAAIVAGLLGAEGAAPEKPRRGPRTFFVSSPQDVVEKMLNMAQVQKDDIVYDLGCGDGRIVVTAARIYGCRAVGIDIDPECVRQARARVANEKVGDLVTIEQKDFFDVDLSKATVVALYLVPAVNERLLPQLEKMKPGCRIVAHACGIPGVRPDKMVRFVSQEDENERPLYLWTLPLRKDERKEE